MNEQMERLKAEVNVNRCCCETCDYCEHDYLDDLICVNSDSEKCADWVEKDYLCEHWKMKRKGRRSWRK